jgi:hypothetical protein
VRQISLTRIARAVNGVIGDLLREALTLSGW